jgi:hypothetical protein
MNPTVEAFRGRGNSAEHAIKLAAEIATAHLRNLVAKPQNLTISHHVFKDGNDYEGTVVVYYL